MTDEPEIFGPPTRERAEFKENVDRLRQQGEVVAQLADLLAPLNDKYQARRVLVVAGIMSGVYDVNDEWRIVERNG